MLKLVLLPLVATLIGYTPKVVHTPFKAYAVRKTVDNIVVIHYDSGESARATIRYLKKRRNSYHYIVERSGTIYKLIDPKYEARHAGLSYFRGRLGLNRYSIGICLVNDGTGPYTENQYKSTAWIIKNLKTRYPDIDSSKIVGHKDIATPFGRKKDPGEHFDWVKLDNLLR